MEGDTYSIYATCERAEEAIETTSDYDDAVAAYEAMCASYGDCHVVLYDAVLGNVLDEHNRPDD